MPSKTIYYHFTKETLRDGSPLPKIGKWLTFKGEIEMCNRGLHASAHPFDALQYAPGQFLHKVKLGGKIITQGDKSVAEKRNIIATIDATDLFWRCSRLYALQVVHLWDCPAVVKQFLETGDESLRAAAMAAARAAAWAAAWDAAWAAAMAAARDAAWAAARAAQRQLFADEVEKEFQKAGR